MEFTKLTAREEYNKPYKENKYACKNGQFKLFIMELLFLRDIDYDYDLIYAGSSPGYHILPMIQRLPNKPKKMILIDLRKSVITPTKDIIIIQKKIGNKTNKDFISYSDVKKLTTNKIVLISDIRTIPTEEVTREIKIADYELQEQMLKKLKPQTASLKFAYPFPDVKELKPLVLTIDISKLYVQPFPPLHSTELRYFYDKSDTKEIVLNNKQAKEFEEKMAYYNRYIRNDYMLFNSLFPDEQAYVIEKEILEVINKEKNKKKKV